MVALAVYIDPAGWCVYRVSTQYHGGTRATDHHGRDGAGIGIDPGFYLFRGRAWLVVYRSTGRKLWLPHRPAAHNWIGAGGFSASVVVERADSSSRIAGCFRGVTYPVIFSCTKNYI